MNRTMIQSISAALLFLLWTLTAAGASLPGRVLWVTEGDTVVVLGPGNAQHKVRLAGIDAPELDQPYGRASKAHLSRRVAGRFVLVDWQKQDRYGRIVGKVILTDQDMGLEQIRAGLAWHYKRYQGEQTPTDRLGYAKAQEEAQDAKRGLWADENSVPPWEWRRGGRSPEEKPAGAQSSEVRPR